MEKVKFKERIIDENIADIVKHRDCIHGININIQRVIPDIIDGLKPVQRRVLYITSQQDKGKIFRKLASISGDTFGKIHPHATTSISDAVVGLVQPWMNNIPLFQDNGDNWGTVKGDEAGADRYIKCRLSDYAQACFFEDWEYSIVDMELGADERTFEPVYLPAKYPNILLNGSLGIGFGAGSNIPPFNFREVINATIKLLKDPNSEIVLIPDSPTGADIIECDFYKMCNTGRGNFKMRCTYEIDEKKNIITITSLPYKVFSNDIVIRIVDLKKRGKLESLISMNDLSGNDKHGKSIKIELIIQDNVNPYKFMKKLLKEVPGLESNFAVNLTVINELTMIDYSIKRILLDWISWRKEQVRVILINKRTSFIDVLKTIEIKLFIMNKNNLEKTIDLFRKAKNRKEIENNLLEVYKNEINIDSIQAKDISNMRFYELTEENYNNLIKEKEKVIKDLEELEKILNDEKGVEKEIIGELRDGDKRFGSPRRSSVIPYKISIGSENVGASILQLSSDGMIIRKLATNVAEEPIPIDSNGFAVKVENDESFIIIDENAFHSFIKVKELPFDLEVPINRYGKNIINGNIIAMLPYDIDSDKSCTLISKKGMIKKFKISEMKPIKKPFMSLDKDDKLVKGIITLTKSSKDLLIYTKNGMGQRLDPNSIRITSVVAKGTYGFKLNNDDEIIGCYSINPEENQYLLYITIKGKVRLNNIDFLPVRNNKHDQMVNLISIPDRDKLLAIIGCNKFDKIQVFFDNGKSEIIEIEHLEESTMSAEPKKITSQNAVTTSIVKAKLL